MPPAGARAGRRRLASLLRAGGPWRRAAGTRFARALRRARDARVSRRAGRLRVRDAGPGQRRHHARGQRGTARPLAAARCPRRSHRGVRAVRAGRRVRRRSAGDARAARTATAGCSTAARPGSPTAASPTSTACSPAPARRPARGASRRSSSTPTRRACIVAERIDVIAPHPLARLRFEVVRVAGHAIASAPGGDGFRIAMRTLDIFRTSVAAAALASRAGPSDEGAHRATSRAMFGGDAGRPAADAGQARADGAQRSTRGAPDLSRCLAARRGQARTQEAAMAKMAATEVSAASDRLGRAAVRRPRAWSRAAGRTAVPRHPRPAHLRGRDRSAETDHRTGTLRR